MRFALFALILTIWLQTTFQAFIIHEFEGGCKKDSELKAIVSLTAKNIIDDVLVMDVVTNVTEDFDYEIWIQFNTSYCTTMELNTCSILPILRNNDYCGILQVAKYLEAFQPRMKCPIKKGIYRAENMSYNVRPYLNMSNKKYFWRVRAELFESKSKKLVECMYLVVSLF